jgi:hypothetical protein
MTTTVTPDIKQDHPESQEWPTLAPDPLIRRAKTARMGSIRPRDASSAPSPTTTPRELARGRK